jgi:intraflagellar transport protein 80
MSSVTTTQEHEEEQEYFLRLNAPIIQDSKHTDLVSCVGWASPDEVYSVADDHTILRW